MSDLIYPIELTKGYVSWVDEEDFERINSFNWYANVNLELDYIRAARSFNKQIIYMHHQVLEIMPWELRGKVIDHKDRNPLNNWRDNLRITTQTINMRNTNRHLNRKGYCFNKRANLWFVYLDRPDQSRINLGYTKTEEQAIIKIAEARLAYN